MSASLLLLSLCLSASPATDGPREHEAALQSLSEGDFESALAHVEAGLRQSRDDSTRAQLHLVRGEVYAALRQYSQMEAAFAQALEADPDSRLDPERVQPTVVTLFESLRERLRGELVIEVEPDAAPLSLDGQPLGTSPWRGPVRIGTHTLDVGSGLTTLQVTVRPGRTEQVRVVLPRTPKADSAPELVLGTQVRAALGLAPGSGVGLEAGARLSGRHVYGELNATVGSKLGASARLGAQAPELAGPLTLFLSLDAYALANPGLLGGGLSAGASLPLSTRFTLFSELSGRWLPSGATYDDMHLLGITGLRFDVAP